MRILKSIILAVAALTFTGCSDQVIASSALEKAANGQAVTDSEIPIVVSQMKKQGSQASAQEIEEFFAISKELRSEDTIMKKPEVATAKRLRAKELLLKIKSRK